MPIPLEPLGAALRRLRERSGLTQEQLAERAGLSSRAIRALEGGERVHPYPHTIRVLATSLGLGDEEASALRASIPERGRGGGHMQAAAAVQTLPRDVLSFTGRGEEMARLLAALSDARRRGSAAGISAIDGMAGVGKTAFAVHAAHRLAAEFPDGQLFLDLRAHAVGQRPVKPADALCSLLLGLGVARRLIPQALDDRAAIWRDRLVNKRMLILLDDAAGTAQVRPLLPGATGCLTLITSRRRLAALEDVIPLTLDPLPTADASELLSCLISADAPGAGAAARVELVELCGQLPLAIRILAGRLRSHPTWTVRDLTSTLRRARDRLAEMRAESLAIDATFDLSYQDLTEARQRLFRRLGLHPGPDIDVYAAAALDGGTLHEAQRGLDDLYNDHLLDEPVPGRYRLHDLARDYARGLAERDDPASNQAILDRLMDSYLHSTITAYRRLVPQSDSRVPNIENVPAQAPDLASRQSALAWLEVERANLSACIQYAATQRSVHAVHIAHALHSFLRGAGYWDQAIANSQAAVAAARLGGDRGALAVGLTDLGDVQRLIGDYPAASASLAEALTTLRDLSDRPGQARALSVIGRVQRLTGGRAAATASLTEALALFRDLGDRLGQARTLRSLGQDRQEGSDYPAATVYLAEALSLSRDLGDRLGEANTLHSIGYVQYWTGEYRLATASLTGSLAIYRGLGNRFGQANAVNDLGRVQCQLGDYPAATVSHTEALVLYRELGSRIGEENALAYLAVVQRSTGDYLAADASLNSALLIAKDVGDQLGEANVLTELAMVRRMLADHPAASASAAKALAISRAIQDRVGEAEALNCLGALQLDVSAADAIVYHRNALRIASDIRCPLEEARALEGIGQCLARTAGPAGGVANLRKALAIYNRIQAPDATRAMAALRSLQCRETSWYRWRCRKSVGVLGPRGYGNGSSWRMTSM